jgi:hypothetical protein
VDASLTRPTEIRIAETPGRAEASPVAVAVIAATEAEARAAAAALLARAPGSAFAPATLAAYLATPRAPGRVILCATRGPEARGIDFLERAAARLLWPAPPEDIDAAIGGLRASVSRPRRRPSRPGRGRRPERAKTALLLEGSVDFARARAALAAVAEAGPRDWIVESARHVEVSARRLASLARVGIRWSALEPIELVAVYAAAAVARSLRRRAWLPGDTPVWQEGGKTTR